MLFAGVLTLLAAGSGAGEVRPPRPIEPGTWVQAGDYPVSAARAAVEGPVGFELAVSQHGNVTDCTVTRSADADLDKATCRIMLLRARFEPAKDASGRAVASTFRSTVKWLLPATPLVPFENASKAIETWSAIPSGRTYCREVASGRMPWVLPQLVCPPDSQERDGPPDGNGVSLLRASVLRVAGQAPQSLSSGKAKRSERAQFKIAVDWHGVVVTCTRSAQSDPAIGEDACKELRNGGKPVFDPISPGSPERVGEIELITAIGAYGDAWLTK